MKCIVVDRRLSRRSYGRSLFAATHEFIQMVTGQESHFWVNEFLFVILKRVTQRSALFNTAIILDEELTDGGITLSK